MTIAGAEGFKWGAIAGTVIGGISKAWSIKKAAATISTATRGKNAVDFAQQKYGGRTDRGFLYEWTRSTIWYSRIDSNRSCIEKRQWSTHCK